MEVGEHPAYDPGTVADAQPQSEALVTVTLTENDGLTTVITLIDFESKEPRDAAVATGMADGMEQSYQLLDQRTAASIAARRTPRNR